MTQPAIKTNGQPPPPKPATKMTLAGVRKGRMQSPLRLFIYGRPKVGKSTCAAGAPSPIFLGADAGTENLDVERLPQPETWEDVLSGVRLLYRETHPYKTLVVDPLNYLEPLNLAAVCTENGWRTPDASPYFRAYSVAAGKWLEFRKEIERVWERGINVIFVAHDAVRGVKNPTGPDYDKYMPAIHKDAIGIFTGWVDAVLFAQTETFAKAEGKERAKGFSTGARVFHTTESAPWEAGNRWSLPETIPLGWTELMTAIEEAEVSADQLRAQIMALAEDVGADAVAKARGYINAAGSRVDRLREVLNALQMKAQQKEGATT